MYTYVSCLIFLCLSCLWMCESVSKYSIAHCRCKCTSLDSCCSLFFFVSIRVRNSTCIRTALDSYFFLTFCLNVFTRIRTYTYTINHCRCICTSLDPTFSLSVFLWRFLLLFYCCSAISIVTECTCIGTSLHSYFCLMSLTLNVRSSVRICYDSMYVHTGLLIVFDFLFLSGDL